jgi:UDP-N-acetylmuramoylalanine--D-glutamate ligase
VKDERKPRPPLRAGMHNMENAMAAALMTFTAGDIMLLSPARVSFDQFVDYEDRGRKFKQAVQDYIAAQSAHGKRL